MNTILIRKGKRRIEYCLKPYSNNAKWRKFPKCIKTKAQMKEYFKEKK